MSELNRNRLAVLLTTLMVIPYLVVFASADVTEDEMNNPAILVDGLPPLLCEDGSACSTPDRLFTIPIDATPPVLPQQWWFTFGPDVDANGFDDRLQDVLAGNGSSPSPTAIVADDGRMTVALVVDYAWHPSAIEQAALVQVLENHGWVGEDGGSEMFIVDILDSIVVDKVPQSALLDIWRLDGVVVVEMQDVIEPFLDIATPATLAGPSSNYERSARGYGWKGDGVVIAVLDSGVDNEHRSLNDFDDLDDDPDLNPNSYTDQKWVAGYDATSNSPNQEGEDDPDDTAGHGSHVAGIALGTGSSDRQYVGAAPGAYLVDLKVFTDVGRANSGDVIEGINWAVNNVDTNWGNNESSDGIDIMQMSFGTASLPGSPDRGDNGTTAQAIAVNQAFDAGIVPVCAMGNDGAQRVPSPASADGCIAVGALHEQNTVPRNDDVVDDYSNHGPRLEDGDVDEWDELKPHVVAPGSHIFSVRAQESTTVIPNQPRPMADNDYVEMDGTSMATPMVSGIVALMLEVDPDLTPQEVRDTMEQNSEFKGSEDANLGTPWNDHFGYGMIDASMLLDALGAFGATTGNGSTGNNTTGEIDPNAGVGDWVNYNTPFNGSWFNAGQTYRLRGNASIPLEDGAPERSINSVFLRASYRYNSGGSIRNVSLFSWTEAVGTDDWWFDFPTQMWQEDADVFVEARAQDDIGRWSNGSWQWHGLGETTLTMLEPSGHGAVSGDVEISGHMTAVYGDRIEYRIGQADWQDGWDPFTDCGFDDYCEADYSFTWDSTEVTDGEWRLSTRLVTESGWKTQEIRRNIEIDNVPPSPDLEPYGGLLIEEQGISIDSAFVNSFLRVHLDIRNSGDQHADDVTVTLYENGNQAASETIPRIDASNIVTLVLGYHPTEVGEHELKVVLDPGNSLSEIDESNNEISITFPVVQRPVGVDLALRQGAVSTTPAIANPNGDVTLKVRVDNLGGSDGTGATFTLEKWTEIGNSSGWETLDSRSLNVVSGGGFYDVPFTIKSGQIAAGTASFRANVSSTSYIDLDSSNNQLEFSLLIDESELLSARRPDIPEDHIPVGWFGAGDENMLFTGETNSLWVHRTDESYDFRTCLEMENDWDGEFALSPAENGDAYVVWTRRFVDTFGLTLRTVSFSTIDPSCVMTEPIDLLPALSLSEGTYWGLDIDSEDGQVLIGGYYRNLITGGTYDDVTSIFTVDSDTPLDSASWRLTTDVIPEVDVSVRQVSNLQVALGEDFTHIMYQGQRNDSTGITRAGVFYAHGELGQPNWAFKRAVGDDTALNQMVVVQNDEGDDVVISAWREGDGYDSELVVIISDSTWQNPDIVRRDAAGLLGLEFATTERGIQMFYDAVGPANRQIHYSLLSEDGAILGGPIAEGWLVMVGRSDSAEESHLFYTSPALDWRARALVDDREPDSPYHGIIETIRLWTGLDQRTFDLAWRIAVATCCIGAILILSVSAGLLTRRKRGHTLTVEIEEEPIEEWLETDDKEVEVLDVDDSTVDDESEELIIEIDDAPQIIKDTEPEPEGDAESGKSARKKRRAERAEEEAEIEVELDELPPPPTPNELPLPPPPDPSELGILPPPPGKDVVCPECSAEWHVKSLELRFTKCPVCDERVDL